MYHKLQYISQGETAAGQLDNIQEALDAGCKWIQLRFKNAGEPEIISIAEEVKRKCAAYGSVFIINDHPQIAKDLDADGVHLGLTDMNVTEARKILGTNKIIGGTANTLDDILNRVDEGCNYIGLGPFRFTTTKAKLSPVLGLNGYKIIMDVLKKHNIQIPVYAIGGIGLEDVGAIIQTGVYGVAMSGAITHHTNKEELIKEINDLTS